MNEHDLVQEWLAIANEDLEAARLLFDQPHRKLLEIICYHCQQSAEKSLKGYLQAKGDEVPRTHEVGELCRLCSAFDITFKAFQVPSERLSLYATHLRYPNRVEVDEKEAVRAIRWAKELLELSEKLCAELLPGNQTN